VHKHQGAIGAALLWLRDRQQAKSRHLRSGQDALQTMVAERFPAVGERELEALLRHEEQADLHDKGKFLYLEAPDKESLLPIMSFKYDFINEPPELSLRVGLFVQFGAELKAMGYRFETLEPGGRHDFHHAQPIREFRKGDTTIILPTPPWVPTGQPSFLLDAEDPITLLLCTLVTIYGLSIITEVARTPFAGYLGHLLDVSPRWVARMAVPPS
jgi:hypothetical protein